MKAILEMLYIIYPESLRHRASFFSKLVLLVTLLSVTTACDNFIGKRSVPVPSNENPGTNVNLSTSFPAARPLKSDESSETIELVQDPVGNQLRLTVAQRQTQSCLDNQGCQSVDDGRIEYNYSPVTGVLESTTEFELGVFSDVTSHKIYIYSVDNPNRLDKVAVSNSVNGNFHTIHDYTYDDEDDPSDREADILDAQDNNTNNDDDGYNANIFGIDIPKLRREYICDKLDVTDPSLSSCNRDNATEVIDYIYYATGTLFKKEFDIDNNAEPNHRKTYFYTDNILTSVETDFFLNVAVDARTTYSRSEGSNLIVAVDNDTLTNDDIEVYISYRLDINNENEVIRECYFKRGFPTDLDGELVTDCSQATEQDYHWTFTWETGPCWVGGIDDIDPETRAIDYLCKQPN